MKYLVFSLILTIATVVSIAQETATQRTMTYIKYRLEGPGLNAVTRQSKELWRIGDAEMRSLEPADTIKKIQPLVIYNPPDFWIINMYDSVGRHSVDQSETKISYAPILSFMKEGPFIHFQFGQEKDYAKAFQSEPIEEKVSDSLTLDVYYFELMDAKVTVNIEHETQNPYSIIAVVDTNTYKVIYEDYQTGLEPDSSLFLPPDSSKITEAR